MLSESAQASHHDSGPYITYIRKPYRHNGSTADPLLVGPMVRATEVRTCSLAINVQSDTALQVTFADFAFPVGAPRSWRQSAACVNFRFGKMNSSASRTVGIVGITSQIGLSIEKQLRAAGYSVVGVSRRSGLKSDSPMHVFDPGAHSITPPLPNISILICLSPLPAICDILRTLDKTANLERIIAFGTTGIFTKADSSSPDERRFVQAQLDGERFLAAWSAAHNIGWTLLRPTMIYGVNGDLNVSFIRSIFRRFHCFPLPIGATGVRQPVHAEDLAFACVKLLGQPVTVNKAYNLGGGEVLPYEDMVRRIRLADGRSSHLIPIPRTVYYLLIHMARLFMGLAHLRTEMVDRMYADLVTDNSAAQQDFGYSPRPFEPPLGNIRPDM
jgi:NAD dependent epimerase/dehydratase family